MCDSINKSHIIAREVEELDFSNDRSVRSVFEFAEIFGINRESCCKILDERIYYWELPLLPCLYYDDKDKDRAGDDFSRYKGFYDIYRYGTSAHNEKDVYIMKLQVRYVLTIRNRTAIRCKLNLPDQRRPLLEYDGFVSEFDNFMYWLFEARHHPGLKQRDCIFMLTKSADRFDDDMRMDGIYLSVNQEVSPKPVSRNIMLIRRYNELNDEDKRNFMKGNMSANIIKGGQGVDAEIIKKL
jgi:hypothetical protein